MTSSGEAGELNEHAVRFNDDMLVTDEVYGRFGFDSSDIRLAPAHA